MALVHELFDTPSYVVKIKRQCDQQRSHSTADLHLCFHIMHKAGFLMMSLILSFKEMHLLGLLNWY